MPDPKLTIQNPLFEADSMLRAHSNVPSMIGPPANSASQCDKQQMDLIEGIARRDAELMESFEGKIFSDRSLSRQLVSFQANKQRAEYRWYKYKEAFSASLVDFLLSRHQIDSGTILDPFAGAGTSLFAAAGAGLDAEGIELLPIGQEIIRTRLMVRRLNADHFGRLKAWATQSEW